MKWVTIIHPEGDKDIRVTIAASLEHPGEYEFEIGRMGTAPCVSFHTDEESLKKIARFILSGIKKERPAVDESVCKHLEKTLDEVIDESSAL